VFHVHLGNGVGDRRYVVTGTQDLRSDYKLGIGNMTVDLSEVRFRPGDTHIRTRVDVGNLRVIVPDNVAVRARGDAQLGRVELLGRAGDGRDVDRSVDQVGARVLVLDAHVGVGKVSVTRAVR
jgi:predicted membrane protein